MIRYLSILFLLLFCSFRLPTIEVAITGHLRSKSHKNDSGSTVFVKGAIETGQGIAKTDNSGNFELGFDDSDGGRTGPLFFYCINSNRDTILLRRVMKLSSDTPEMTFWIK